MDAIELQFYRPTYFLCYENTTDHVLLLLRDLYICHLFNLKFIVVVTGYINDRYCARLTPS